MNRNEHTHAPAPHTYRQIDAYTGIASCACGVRIEQTERWFDGVAYVWPWEAIA